MAASVQELLLAAQAKQKQHPLSALAEVINAGAAGYGRGVVQKKANADAESSLADAEVKRQTILSKLIADKHAADEQAKLRQEMEQTMTIQTETGIRDRLQGTKGAPQPATPRDKVETVFKTDEKGNISKEVKIIPPKPVETPNTLDEILAEDVRLGKRTMEEAMALKNKPPVDRSMQSAITKSKVEIADAKALVSAVIPEIERVQKLNKDSYGGLAGSAIMKTKSALNTGPDDIKFKNTSDVLNTMKAQVARVLKSTFGGQLSDGERQYLNEVYGALDGMSQTERDIAMTNVATMLRGKITGAESKLRELTGDEGDSTPTTEVKKIRVKRKDGKTGTINESDFDASKYERIP